MASHDMSTSSLKLEGLRIEQALRDQVIMSHTHEVHAGQCRFAMTAAASKDELRSHARRQALTDSFVCVARILHPLWQAVSPAREVAGIDHYLVRIYVEVGLLTEC